MHSDSTAPLTPSAPSILDPYPTFSQVFALGAQVFVPRDEAIAHLEAAERARADEAESNNDLCGEIEALQERYDDAIEELKAGVLFQEQLAEETLPPLTPQQYRTLHKAVEQAELAHFFEAWLTYDTPFRTAVAGAVSRYAAAFEVVELVRPDGVEIPERVLG